MKIDIFSYILPKRCLETLLQKALPECDLPCVAPWALATSHPVSKGDILLRLMDEYPDVVQVLSLAGIPF